MIKEDELIEIGRIGKPHGTRGEINVYLDDNIDYESVEKIALDCDGIYVPFFISGQRHKRNDNFIWTIDGVEDENEAAKFTNKTIYAFRRDNVIAEDGDEGDGLYASDLIGYTLVHANGVPVGKIVRIEDSTENALFVIEMPDSSTKFIPIANELIDDIDTTRKFVVMTLPEGILDL